MKQYEVLRSNGRPNWDTIPVAPIDSYLWSDVRSIVPSAQMTWDEDALYVRLQAVEPQILRRFTGKMDMVCKDSCLEFFFCPKEDDRYFNFEGNPNGSMYIGYGRPGADRCRLYRDNFNEIFSVTPFDIPGGWGYELRIPVSFVQIFQPDFRLYSGLKLQGNFFKCGDETAQEHYMSWNPVDVPKPNFHLPAYFGELILK